MSDSTDPKTESPIRLQKRIANSGLCSRRKAEEYIEEGRVEVNGETITTMGVKVLSSDQVMVDGKALPELTQTSIALYKPAGYITSKSDPHHVDTIMDLVPFNYQHLKPAGRLDKESEGLIILSTDGALIQKLTHPKHQHTKTYEILVKGEVTESSIQPLIKGELELDGYQLNPAEVKILNTTKQNETWLEITLTEGRKRQIRRMMEKIGHPVYYLCRMAIGSLSLYDSPLSELSKGEFLILNDNLIQQALQ